jgi:Integrase core domain
MVDDHIRLAYSEITTMNKATRALSLSKVLQWSSLATESQWCGWRPATTGATQKATPSQRYRWARSGPKFIRPQCPWQNGGVEQFNRTLQTERAYRQVFESNDDRSAVFQTFSTATTTTGDTSKATHQSADCHQPDGQVQPALLGAEQHRLGTGRQAEAVDGTRVAQEGAGDERDTCTGQSDPKQNGAGEALVSKPGWSGIATLTE